MTSSLSTREKEVLQLIAFEYTAKEIATLLYISTHTVISHRKNLQEKMAVRNTAGMVRKGFEWGILNIKHGVGSLKNIAPLIVLMAFALFGFSQSIAQQIISTDGGTITSSDKSTLAYTIGEPIAGHVGNQMTINQGFLNNSADLVSSNFNLALLGQVEIFPNPATDNLNITMQESKETRASILDLNGRILMNSKALHKQSQFKVTHLTSGTYLLLLTNETGSALFKFLKME